MQKDDEIKQLLTEIRDNQKLALQRQEEHLELARLQVDRAGSQVKESIKLQKEAMDRFKRVGRVVFPLIVLCIALIIYLIVRFL
ncbi:MAG: hypothetical protein WBM41_06030 [Arenicellales bacterium]